MITVPLWLVLVLAIMASAAFYAWFDARRGGYGAGLGGCLALLVATIASLCVLLAHSWGWL